MPDPWETLRAQPPATVWRPSVPYDTLYHMVDPNRFPDRAFASAALTRRAVLQLAGAAAAAAVLAACGDDAGARTEGGDSAGGDDPVTAFTIVAEDMQWDTDRIVVPAGEQITATIENLDEGVPHNLHIEAPGDPKTDLEDGIVTQTLVFTIDEPGEHRFVCDAHPNMTGTIAAV